MEKKRSKGIIIFSILICSYALWDLNTYSDFRHYAFLFQPLPERIILVRYFFSIFLRIVLVITGIGILFLNEYFRRIILFISFFTVATIYWKHPVICFKNIVMNLVARGAFTSDVTLTPDTVIWILIVINYIIDISFALCLIYFFTRPQVKEQFK
ncbi:MAG: hypothetical protein NTZ63_02800 [Candidatus Omnitrophica bacterium]|nr:hypothetical protein [Candidatus Omnitrophota bacterium]